MLILASKFIYLKEQKNFAQILSPFKNLSIQLSFFQKQDFLKIDHKLLKETCEKFDIKIPTVHAPTVDVFDKEFSQVLELIKKTYKVRLISIHPQRGELNSALAKLEEYAKVIGDLDVILAYENFPSSVLGRKWICRPCDMYTYFNLPFLKLTFDTSHLDSPSECIREFKRVYDKVAIIHLSDKNRKRQHPPSLKSAFAEASARFLRSFSEGELRRIVHRSSQSEGGHLPLGSGSVPYREFIEYLKTCAFEGPLVLEYMPDYEKRLIGDVKRLTSIFMDDLHTTSRSHA